MKKLLKSIAAVMTASILMLQPMTAFATYSQEVDLKNAYAELYIDATIGGACARTTEGADFEISGTAWDFYWLPYNFYNVAENRSYCDAYASTRQESDLMKKVQATIYVSTSEMDDEKTEWMEVAVMR